MDSLPIVLTDLGRAIAALRKQTGLSQEHFADEVGIHRTEMGRLERGKTNPRVDTLHLVAGGLGVSIGELFAQAEGKGRASKPAGRGAKVARRISK
jgi:transcriptional regulator with XRE-family HTH domain